MSNIVVSSNGQLEFDGKTYRCVVGQAGIVSDKREGDGGTPAGTWPLRKVWYRADKVAKPQTALPTQALQVNDAWCDDDSHSTYNRAVKLPHDGSYENLWRPDDDLHDLIVEVGYNDDPPVPGKGSAIFIHVARPAFTPTAGCVALAKADLQELLGLIGNETQILIKP